VDVAAIRCRTRLPKLPPPLKLPSSDLPLFIGATANQFGRPHPSVAAAKPKSPQRERRSLYLFKQGLSIRTMLRPPAFKRRAWPGQRRPDRRAIMRSRLPVAYDHSPLRKSMNQTQTCPTTAPGITPAPTRWGLWPSIVLMLLYLSVQVKIGVAAIVGVMAWRIAAGRMALSSDTLLEQTAAMQDLITGPAFQWLALIALLVAGGLTLLTAWLWLGCDQRGPRVLLGLTRPVRLPLAAVPLLTLLMLVSTSFVIYWLFGPVSVEAQELLFQEPLLGPRCWSGAVMRWQSSSLRWPLQPSICWREQTRLGRLCNCCCWHCTWAGYARSQARSGHRWRPMRHGTWLPA
jgi:hypothetical protein